MRRLLTIGALACLLPTLAAAVEPGEVVISELMIRSQSAPEWVELYNDTGSALSMEGCTLSDPDTDEPLDGLTIPAGGYVVLADDAACVAFTDASGVTCVHPTDLTYSSLTLNDSGSEELRVVCDGVTIDAVTYEWPDVADDCTGADTCSVQVVPGSLNATDNDAFPDNWCVPPPARFAFDTLGREVLATPGEDNVCPSAGNACGTGDAVFTELMIAPPTSTREWFELTVLNAAGCDLHGCELREGPFPDPLVDPTNEEWGVHVVDAPGNTLPIALGEYALFAKSADTVVGDLEDSDETEFIYADYRYGTSIGFGNSEPGYLHLVCDGVPVDSVPYDWERFEAGCTNGGCSVGLLPSREDAEGNDDLGQWCLPPDEPVLLSSTGLPMTGTPGEEGQCQQRTWPGPAQVLFSEVQGQPDSGQTGNTIPEFFELSNRGEGPADMTGCRISRLRMDRETGEYAPTSTSTETIFGTEAESTVLDAGAVQVWSRSLCLDGRDPEISSCTGTELIYTGIDFSNSERERISLRCPDGAGGEVLVDAMEYDFSRTGIRGAHSVEFDPSIADAGSLNDEPDAWCEASFLDCYATNGEGQCNYGTPGVSGPCKVDRSSSLQSGVPGCRCDVVEPSSVGWIGLVFAGFLLRRRKRE
ncbi:MAG: lamin tail domain-containing protein [Deltaproteobacteria bacterium]|nr:lamin tail domain-containing protein [Deltaproteobacteria bacterium]